MSKEGVDAASLLFRSGYNHVQYIKPSANLEPILYAGKVESTVITLLLDTFGITPKDIVNKTATFRSCTAFNLQWRAYDEVLDEERFTTDPVTEADLENIPVYHKYAKRTVTGEEGMQIALDSIFKAIPQSAPNFKQRMDRAEGLLAAYRSRVAVTANNPLYHKGDILTYPLALQSKDDVTGYLGEIGAGLCSLLLDVDDLETVELFKRASVAMQFGDDLLDWRKDLNDYKQRKDTSTKPIRPVENLLVSTLAENTTEKTDCEAHLTDARQRSVLWLKELAPNTLELFKSRFQNELDRLPPHRYTETLKGIISLTFYKLLPLAPESGWFFKWAKY